MQRLHPRIGQGEAQRRPEALAGSPVAMRLAQARWALDGYEAFAQAQMQKAADALKLVDRCRAEIVAAELELERTKG